MMHNDEIDLTREEAAALRALPREMEPGDLLETRVLRALRSEGHLGGVQHRVSRGAALGWRIAAAVALFAGGVATGRYVLASSAPATASVTAPVTNTRDASRIAPRNDTRAVQQNETVVAQREMWL